MKILLGVALIIVPCVGIGAWLVTQGHPWFGLLAMLIGGCIEYKGKE